MSLVLLVLVALFGVAGACGVRALRSGARTAGAVSQELAATARTTSRWRLAGLVVGLVVGVVAAYQGGLGRGLMLAAPLFALCILAGVLVGELWLQTPAGEVRSAGLEVRRVRDYVPRRLGVLVGGATATLAAVLAWTTAMGSADDLGRAGRSLARRCSAVSGEAHGPWPGSFYAIPLAVVVVVGLAGAAVALTRLVRRPRSGGSVAVDDGLRRSAAAAVTAAVGLLVTVPLAGVSAVAAGALLGFGCAPAAWTVAGWILLALLLAAVLLAAWCVAVLLSPADSPAPAPRTVAAER